jgi:hypothetical protein
MKYIKGIAQKILNTIIARNLPTNHASAQCLTSCDSESIEIIRFYHTKSQKRYSQVTFLQRGFLITKKRHDFKNYENDKNEDWELFYYSQHQLDAAKEISKILCEFRKNV